MTAIDYADSLIRNALGSGEIKDAAAITRGGEFWKTVAMFYTFGNAMWNTFFVKSKAAQHGLEGARKEFLLYLLMTYAIEPVVVELLSGRPPDEDESWLKWYFKASVGQASQMFPVLRDISSAVVGTLTGNYRPYRVTPAQSVAETGIGLLSKIVKGNYNEATAYQFANMLSYIAPYGQQLNVWGFNLYDYLRGNLKVNWQDIYKRIPLERRR